MNRIAVPLLAIPLLAGCDRSRSSGPALSTVGPAWTPPKLSHPEPAPEKQPTLLEARRGFQTKLRRRDSDRDPVDEPPPKLFRTVRYAAPAGKLAAYLSVAPGDGRKRPAIIWIFGGFGNGIGSTAWEEQPATNDQSASAFRKAGIVMMYPALRGGHDGVGVKEGFLGEVDDVLAAADFLARQDFVDPKRIYLGGHSTGGTLALLAAECSSRFRAVFCFGPVEDVAGYGQPQLPFDVNDERERRLRAPGEWLHSVQSPTFVFEGSGGNIESLREMQRTADNPLVQFFPVSGADHFSILAPATRLIAEKILRDEGATTNIRFANEEINRIGRR